MADASTVVILDTLASLREAELSGIFRFMGEDSPYLTQATPELRAQLQQILQAGDKRAAELAAMIQSLGGTLPTRTIIPEEQYLAHLSLKFLMPKLVDAQKLTIRRYENATRAIHDAPPAVKLLLKNHLAEHRSQLHSLESSASNIAAN